MTQAISGVASFASELAELLIQTESAQSDSAQTERDAARQDFLSDAKNQVDALHAAADDIEHGAFVSAAFTLAGAACTVTSAFEKFSADMDASKLQQGAMTSDIASATSAAKIWDAAGASLSKLAAPANTIIGESSAADANANAKYFETLSEQAKWAEGDASTEIDTVAKLGDKILDLLQGIDQDQNSANSALIGRI
jgi:hypothetical protein